MDKKKLRNIQRPQAKPEYFDMVERNGFIKYIAEARKVEQVIQLTFFRKNELKKKCPDAYCRLFIGEDDYITQDLTVSGTKWKSGQLATIIEFSWDKYIHTYNPKGIMPRYADVVFSDKESQLLLEERFPKRFNQSYPVWDYIRDWQVTVCEKRRDQINLNKLVRTNHMMDLVPELPGDFEIWAENQAMYNHRYLIYDASSTKRVKKAYCTHCMTLQDIDTKKMKLKNNERGLCPNCESSVHMKPFSYWHDHEMGSKYVAIIQKVNGMLLARYFSCSLHFYKGNLKGEGWKKKLNLREECRTFYTFIGEHVSRESFEYRQWKSLKGDRWCPDEDKIRCADAVVYTNNLPGEYTDTPFRYSGIKEFQENDGCQAIPLWKYMEKYPKHRAMEQLVKMGLTNITREMVEGAYGWRCDGDSLYGDYMNRFTSLKKAYKKLMCKYNGRFKELKVLQAMQQTGNEPDEELFLNFMRMFDDSENVIYRTAKYGIKLKEFMKYADYQIRFSSLMNKCCNGEDPKTYCQKFGETLSQMKNYVHKCVRKDKREKDSQVAKWWLPLDEIEISYIPKSVERLREKCKNVYKDWDDYINWCNMLGYNLKDRAYLLPSWLTEEHDRVYAEYTAHMDRIQKEKEAKLNKQVSEIMEQQKDIEPLQMRTDSFMIIVPKDAQAIKEEGRNLHHCVGGYVDKVAKGLTMILFVRRTSAPDKSFFTMEWKDGKVAQCRGYKNSDMPDDVKAFTVAFGKKMTAFEKKKGGSLNGKSA